MEKADWGPQAPRQWNLLEDRLHGRSHLLEVVGAEDNDGPAVVEQPRTSRKRGAPTGKTHPMALPHCDH